MLSKNVEIFSILYNLHDAKKLTKDVLKKQCADLELRLTHTHKSDINGVDLFDEIEALEQHLNSEMDPHEILKYIYENGLTSTFPNVAITIRIFLTLPITVATGERSFSKLKIIKNYRRSTMAQERLSSLGIISIEHKISECLT